MKATDILRKRSLAIGIGAMALAILATLAEAGSLLQKSLFMVAVPTLGFVAWLNRQKMFLALQIVATIGAILAFFTIPQSLKYAALILPAIAAVGYLVKIKSTLES